MTESDAAMIRAAGKERAVPRAVGMYLAQIAIVFAVQFAAGKLGEALPIINSGGIGPVWPASGIALAALLLCGYRVWPGVAAGAFLLAFLSPIPCIAAVVYAAGTTLVALTAAFLLRRVVNFDPSLSRLGDALWLIVFGGLGSSTVSASIGVAVLYAAHVRGWFGFGSAWLIYWLGDSMGVLLVTPLALTFPNLLKIRPWVRIAELAALLLLLTTVSFIIFSDGLFAVRLHFLAFAVFPFVVWAAVRFGVSGAALSNVFIAGIATAETASGSGPFSQNTPFINAVLLDVFFGVLSVSGLALAAVIAERERAESEREQLVREQAASEARLRLAAIVESSDDAIIGKDIDGIVTDWNNGAERLYGYSAGEVIGKPVSFLMPPNCSDDFPKIMETLRQGNTVKDYQTVRQRKDGTRIEISLTVSPIRDTEGRIVGSSAIARDISERKRAEESLRESEERLRLAAQAGRMYAFDLDVATDAIVRSGECAHILGWTDHPAHDTNRQFLTRVHPDDREQYVAIEARLNPENATYQTSYRLLRPDDGVVWLEESGRAVFDEQGRMLRMIGMVADVTDRKQAEERLREYEKAVEGSEEMIAVVDREYRYLIANRKFLNYRSMTKEQVVGRLVPEVLSKGVFETVVKEKLDECFQGKVVRYEMRYTYPELGERDVFISNFPIEGFGGVDRVACILQDITERKRTEEALRKSEERFRLAAQAGKAFAYEWDAATDVILRSGEYAQILGVDEATHTTGQQAIATVHPDDRERLSAAVAELSPDKPYLQISYRILRPDRTVIWVERNSRAHFDEQGRMLRIVGMVADITERKLAEEALRESEARFRLAAQAGKMYAYEWDVATDVAVRSEEYANILGLTGVPRCHTREQFLSRVHPDDRAKFIAAVADLTPENPTTQISYRVLRPDGAVIWLEKSGRAFFDAQGKMLRMIGIVADITERKLGEEALSGVSRRLIEAQEQERTRIARELHDDFGQRLALLTIELELLQQNSSDLPADIRRRMGELRKRTSEIATDIQSLSHELHSSRLEYVGIAAAMRGLCQEFGEQQKVEIDFKTHGLPSPVPPDISLCLFRVLQEALHNSAKHSGARRFEVQLWGMSGEIHLTVRDSGSGFNRKAAKDGRGLGLISMEERLRLLNGTFSIESQPQRGTTIHARVPLSSESDPMRAAG